VLLERVERLAVAGGSDSGLHTKVISVRGENIIHNLIVIFMMSVERVIC
jgi:hypothetical protein